MYLNVSFDLDFDDFWMHLKNKYPKRLFDLEGVGKQTDFSDFSKSFFTTKSTTADVSVDANSNVTDINIVNYTNELPKPLFKYNSYYVLWKKLKQLYGPSKACDICEKALTGTIYINDFFGIASGLPYCFNYSTFDVMLQGLPMVTKIKSVPPKYLYSFKSQLEQLVVIASNSTLGATGLADVFIVMTHYIDKIFNTGNDAGFYFSGWYSEAENNILNSTLEEYIQENPNRNFLTKEIALKTYNEEIEAIKNKTSPHNKKTFDREVWKYVKENIVSFIYTLNQPARGGAQSPFTNVSIYDDVFLNELIPGYAVDGILPKKETVKKLQEIFLDTMNEELQRTQVTFPVTTACFSVDEQNKLQDEQFLKMIAKQNLKFGFINIYGGKTSTLSSCCFSGEEIIEIFNIETKVKEITPMKDFVSLYIDPNKMDEQTIKIKEQYQIHSINFKEETLESSIITGILKKPNKDKKLFNFTVDNKTISVTPDHLFTVKEKESGKLIEIRADKIDKNKHLLPRLKMRKIQFEEIENIIITENFDFVYDIELEKNHYFAANEIISHNCRLRSDITTEYFNSFGSGSSKVGSLGVATLNLPRLAYKHTNDEENFFEELKTLVNDAAKINHAKRKIIEKRIDNGNHPLYTLGFIDLKKQYNTCGLTGIWECLDILGYDILTEEGQQFLLKILETIDIENDKNAKQYSSAHNVEQIPAESTAVKLAEKDKLLKYQTEEKSYDMYSNQFIPLTVNADILERIRIQGIFDSKFSGGSIMHLNIGTAIENPEQIEDLIKTSIEKGVIYFAINYKLLKCEKEHMTVGNEQKPCSICGSSITDVFSRVVGYLVNSKNFNKTRREVEYPNRVFYDQDLVSNL